jgi:hypothetical protein
MYRSNYSSANAGLVCMYGIVLAPGLHPFGLLSLKPVCTVRFILAVSCNA